ncbi:hypothetical protein CYMTET_10387 [Cymbomonas tetramitiformis]|uniref:Peptidase A2 domain-containing protein n=1 Tax=Cymbomonas tetramitiformis TaxID=36881 RepID=A0AAE0GPU8_9CHLO|nr:hypothetical protein CYMTET_10387 [Cymbomonas tetramitiformis]
MVCSFSIPISIRGCEPSTKSACVFKVNSLSRKATLRPCPRQRRLQCAASQNSLEELQQELRPLRARELKQRLNDLGVDSSECFDKEALLAKLSSALLDSAKSSSAGTTAGAVPLCAPLFWTQAASMFSGVRTQQGDYCGLTVRLPGLNSGDLNLIIDTASSVTILTPQVAKALNAPRTNVVGSGIAGTGQLGGTFQVSLGQVQLHPSGATVVPEETAVVMELPTAPGTSGILGLTFLNQMGALVFTWGQRPGRVDFYARAMLDDAAWRSITAGLHEVPLMGIVNGLLCVEVMVDTASGNPTSMMALLDTGAAFSVMNQAGANACKVPTAVAGSGVEPMWVVGADGNPMQMAVSDGAVTIGLQKAPNVAFEVDMLVGDLPAFASLGLGGSQPSIILGLDALLQRERLVLSTLYRRMWL